ncbi:MAG: type III-B CRISPR module-associated protein Cmr5 [Planctomycetaceae bacterium]
MTVMLRKQVLASQAFTCAEQRFGEAGFAEYLSFARSFPTLIHTCGLAQAAAFASSRKGVQRHVLIDLATVMSAADPALNPDNLSRVARETPDVSEYIRLSRLALESAGWIKRYAEALAVTASQPGDEERVDA